MKVASNEYIAAVHADARHMTLHTSVGIFDPDAVLEVDEATGMSSDFNNQIIDKNRNTETPLATLEENRWELDGSFDLFNDGPTANVEVGFMSSTISDSNGIFQEDTYVKILTHNIGTLQGVMVYFSSNVHDGVGENFNITIYGSGGVVEETILVSGNSDTVCAFDGFTVNSPYAIRIDFLKWSIPNRRARVIELVAGLYEEWDENDVANFNIQQQIDLSAVSLPYSTFTISVNNQYKKFDPRSKQGIFQSIEERQPIEASVGVWTVNGNELLKVGTFYQNSGGWTESDYGMTIQWKLVDIVGLLANRAYKVPYTQYATIGAWVADMVGQLGISFVDSWSLSQTISDTITPSIDMNKLQGKTCGNVLLWLSQLVGGFPTSTADGKLTIVVPTTDGDTLTLDDMEKYPQMSANSDCGFVQFTFPDGTVYIVNSGTTASSASISIENPWIQTTAKALEVARNILAYYGGNKITITGRGNPTSECGDTDRVWITDSDAVSAIRIKQALAFSNGVMHGLNSELIQGNGPLTYNHRQQYTRDGSFVIPSGVTELRLVLVGGGKGGSGGTRGSMSGSGARGSNGTGGKVNSIIVNVVSGTVYNITIGTGGLGGMGQRSWAPAEPGADGTASTFGDYSSANGSIFNIGFVDIMDGSVFGRTGVNNPLAPSGDGGIGGNAGTGFKSHTETKDDGTIITIVDSRSSDGGRGMNGANGCVIVYWNG